jgi:4-hydroxy-3-methylbut-2-en-1-yl diphosphate synthase IspG/GcpE
MLSDFMQVLNSARDIYTKNYYFSDSKLFSIISLLQKQRLNPGNYSKQEIIMKLFYGLLEMIRTCMQNFRLIASIDICEQLI